ncbi:hypothetical protein SELSPUOL_00807 [Selenomonas sputigena ATCC 35185]|uniref:Uncharacterized protein n=1 Tax=Selenomonas sputigena (strain ATCC 35185 / DSM 20758 / CCUG 44933 / VPI D19B-28) TaxID=546271 RepID=C9LU02_SELS3|nr:hypothetical protein SELSPUOL_00807 [Selenomonas sputigena ATCC 35185]
MKYSNIVRKGLYNTCFNAIMKRCRGFLLCESKGAFVAFC